jgi:hypothetical protein
MNATQGPFASTAERAAISGNGGAVLLLVGVLIAVSMFSIAA